MKKKPVRLGLYGCGNRTRALLDSVWLDGECEVAAAYDLRREAMESIRADYGGDSCDTSEALVGHPKVDAFVISLDPFSHPAAFFETLEAGKPIFIEKPIAMTVEEARRMTDAAEERKVPVHVGFVCRYLPRHVAAMKFIAENDPGALLSVTCRIFHAGETEMINCLNNCPDNFRLKVTQIPFHHCHTLDMILLYGGKIKSVSSVGRKVIKRQYPSPDEIISNIVFENGCVGDFHYSSMAYRCGGDMRVHAENYTLTFEPNGDLSISRRPALRSLREDGSKDCRSIYHRNVVPEIRSYSTPISSVDCLIMLDFLNCVRTGEPMRVTMRDGLAVAEFAEAIEGSWRENKQITLPLSGGNAEMKNE